MRDATRIVADMDVFTKVEVVVEAGDHEVRIIVPASTQPPLGPFRRPDASIYWIDGQRRPRRPPRRLMQALGRQARRAWSWQALWAWRQAPGVPREGRRGVRGGSQDDIDTGQVVGRPQACPRDAVFV